MQTGAQGTSFLHITTVSNTWSKSQYSMHGQLEGWHKFVLPVFQDINFTIIFVLFSIAESLSTLNTQNFIWIYQRYMIICVLSHNAVDSLYTTVKYSTIVRTEQ